MFSSAIFGFGFKLLVIEFESVDFLSKRLEAAMLINITLRLGYREFATTLGTLLSHRRAVLHIVLLPSGALENLLASLTPNLRRWAFKLHVSDFLRVRHLLF